MLFTFLGRRQQLSSQEYQLNALAQLEEAVSNDMDEDEHQQAEKLLQAADGDDDTTKALKILMASTRSIVVERPNILERSLNVIRRFYRRAWQGRHSDRLVQAFFVIETLLFVLAVIIALYDNIDDAREFFAGTADYGQSLVIGQLASTGIASVLAIIGIARLTKSRQQALEFFRFATLTNLLLTQFFVFSRIQFGALPGFLFNLLLLIIINFARSEEDRRRPETS